MCCRGSAARHRGPRSPRRRSLRHLRAGGRWQRAACRCSGSAFCAPTPAEVQYAVRQRPPDAAKHPVERSTSCPSRPWRGGARDSPELAQSSFRASRSNLGTLDVAWKERSVRCLSRSLSLLQSNLLTTGPDRRGSSRRRTTGTWLTARQQRAVHGDRGQILRGPQVQSTRRARAPTEARRAELGVAARPRARPR